VVSDAVSGAVTLRIRQVPWEQVLHTIARLKGLDLRRDGNIYLVTPRAR
jgi:type IV pilus assembly protein PilQ